MSTLRVGARAPNFELPSLDSGSIRLDNVLQSCPLTLVTFFKTSCPTCHYAWPFYERLYRAYGKYGLAMIAISQHSAEKTGAYRNQYGATFPHLIDDDLTVSRLYDPEFVPTGFLIDRSGRVLDSFSSWDRDRFVQVGNEIARRLNAEPVVLVREEDNALPFKGG